MWGAIDHDGPGAGAVVPEKIQRPDDFNIQIGGSEVSPEWETDCLRRDGADVMTDTLHRSVVIAADGTVTAR